MTTPTLPTVLRRWPSLVDEVFPRWPVREIDACFRWAVGPDWATLGLDQVVLRLHRRGILLTLDDDPRQTLLAIRRRYRDMQWLEAARRYREEDDPFVPWH